MQTQCSSSPMLTSKQQSFVEDHTTCAICGDDLEIRIAVKQDRVSQRAKVIEVGYCPHCDIQTHCRSHVLQ